MREPHRDQPRPTADEIRALWQTEVFTHVGFTAPALDALLAAFRSVFIDNDGAEFAMFALNTPVLLRLASNNWSDESTFLTHLLRSSAFRAALPEIVPPLSLESLHWQETNPYILAGELAHFLKVGGAYESFTGTGHEAKVLGERACEALFGERFEDIEVYRATFRWARWFRGTNISGCTWVGFDKIEQRTWVLCFADDDGG